MESKYVCFAMHSLTYMVYSEMCKKKRCPLLSHGKSPKDSRGNIGTPDKYQDKHSHKFISVHESHYSGREKYYLDNSLNVKTMYALFKEQYPQSKYFRKNFTLSSGQPQIDTCCTGQEISVKIKNPRLNDVAKRFAVMEKMLHEKQAKVPHTHKIGKRNVAKSQLHRRYCN
ncbi:hypothetical protein PR048_033619 [Dryococelus australis]|uniref:Uncharacterized protein n=1 Tax=Dryococelus australis TaxID=614101 RepID=A0ABQ9G0S9_9NEOP|nr:hypothetical protein PR048_033619 [Dryococelus australis]